MITEQLILEDTEFVVTYVKRCTSNGMIDNEFITTRTKINPTYAKPDEVQGKKEKIFFLSDARLVEVLRDTIYQELNGKSWNYKRLLIIKNFNEFIYNFFIKIS